MVNATVVRPGVIRRSKAPDVPEPLAVPVASVVESAKGKPVAAKPERPKSIERVGWEQWSGVDITTDNDGTCHVALRPKDATATGERVPTNVIGKGEVTELHLMPMKDRLVMVREDANGKVQRLPVTVTLTHETIALRFKLTDAEEAISAAVKRQPKIREGLTVLEEARRDLRAVIDEEIKRPIRLSGGRSTTIAAFCGETGMGKDVRRILTRTGNLGLRLFRADQWVRADRVDVDEAVLETIRTVIARHFDDPDTVCNVLGILAQSAMADTAGKRADDRYTRPAPRTLKLGAKHTQKVRNDAHGPGQSWARRA